MISTVIYFLIKVILVITLLVAMALVLFGIGHLYRREEKGNREDIKKLRDEVRHSDHVISRHSVFSIFLMRRARKN
ncbi:MAG: hypothetical protein NC097_05205 [Clostridium sp.]|nr:hypothetical protein [Prevotella sp.]MCM1429174.1 hypothetical protein [Clostridium sp.]MCM1475852.1 hypothetical protein [Muribaculaceae bacterium]